MTDHHQEQEQDMDECDKNLLQTYLNSPRIWDAASVFDTVMRLHNAGLIEPVDPNRPGLMQITDQGRAALQPNAKPYTWGDRPLVEITIQTRHPEDYMLLNFANRTAWQYDEHGTTQRVNFPAGVEKPRD